MTYLNMEKLEAENHGFYSLSRKCREPGPRGWRSLVLKLFIFIDLNIFLITANIDYFDLNLSKNFTYLLVLSFSNVMLTPCP